MTNLAATPVARCATLLVLLACAATGADARVVSRPHDSQQTPLERAQLESLARRADQRIQAL